MEALEEAKRIIASQIYNHQLSYEKYTDFDGYHKVYFQSNEYIDDYLNLADLNNKKRALTVCASGDHAFSLIVKGINDIELFDINKLTEYFVLGLKRAMIMKYDYQDYLNVFTKLFSSETNLNDETDIIQSILPYMDKKYREFWQNLLDYNYFLQKYNKTILGLIEMLVRDDGFHLPLKLNYLSSEKKYNILKNKIVQTNLHFNYLNALDLSSNFPDNYFDVIILSNILDYVYLNWGYYWPLSKLLDYTTSLEKISKNEALIFLHYIFNTRHPFNFYKNSNLPLKDLQKLNIPKTNNQIILKRVKK